MKKVKAAELVFDFDLYPRNNVDTKNISNIAMARAAGVELPPVIIDKKSRRIIDGFHRVKERLRTDGSDAEIWVEEKTYRSEADMFLDAVRYNASHGAKLDSHDKTHCALIAERLRIPPEAVAGALNMPVDDLATLRNTRTATGAGNLEVPLKRTISEQFSGKKLTKRQEEANRKLSGMNQVFYANQLIELLESNMLDTSDEGLLERLRHLNELLDSVLAANT